MAKYGAALRPDALSRSPVRALEQEPSAAFGLVDPRLDHARAGDVAIFVAQSVDLPHTGGKLEIVVTELSQHVERSDVVRIIVQYSLESGNMSDGADRRSPDLAYPFGYRICRRKNLSTLFVQHTMVVAKMRTGYMPMEILG